MRNLKVLIMLFMAVSMLSTACKKDEVTNPNPTTYSGTYQLYMDGNKVAEGTTEEVGLVTNLISIANGDAISLLISGVPVTIGESVNINNSSFSVSILGQNLLLSDGSDEGYFAIDGTITRTSSTKVSFQGNCSELFSSTTYSFSGFAESEAYKNIENAK
ncbi:MAG: hypothetical protein K9H16_13450 [Bacteroidales bacterium]|nr:hypothetical protein [Bacteroidales bacterium]